MDLVIGCGNLLRGDDAVGPALERPLLDPGLPDDRGRALLYELVDVPEVYTALATAGIVSCGSATDVNGENRWDRVEHDSLCWPYGLSDHERHLAVADSGNNRVMIWTAP